MEGKKTLVALPLEQHNLFFVVTAEEWARIVGLDEEGRGFLLPKEALLYMGFRMEPTSEDSCLYGEVAVPLSLLRAYGPTEVTASISFGKVELRGANFTDEVREEARGLATVLLVRTKDTLTRKDLAGPGFLSALEVVRGCGVPEGLVKAIAAKEILKVFDALPALTHLSAEVAIAPDWTHLAKYVFGDTVSSPGKVGDLRYDFSISVDVALMDGVGSYPVLRPLRVVPLEDLGGSYAR